MAHIEKCTGSKAVKLLEHDIRAHGAKDEHIDPTLTHLNYNFCNRSDYIGYMNKRINEITEGKKPRKDAIKAVSTVVTVPKDLPEHERPAFFKSVYDFLEKEFGKENIISAAVHRDEPNAQDHIHVKAVPCVIDKNTGKEKLSAKELVTRGYLKQFHPKLQKHVETDLGHSVSIINGATAGKNKEIAELKADTAIKKVEEAERRLAAINAEYEPKKAYLEGFAREQESIHENVKENKTITGKVKSVEMPPDKWERHAMSYMDKQAVQRMKEKTEQVIKAFQESAAGEKQQEILTELREWQKYAKDIEHEIERVQTVFKAHPEIARRFFELEQEDKNTLQKAPETHREAYNDFEIEK